MEDNGTTELQPINEMDEFNTDFNKFLNPEAEESQATEEEAPEGTPEDNLEEEADEATDVIDEEEADEQASIEAPENWSSELKQSFSKLDDDGKSAMLDTYKSLQADYTKKTTEVADDRKFAQSIKSAFDPVRDYMSQSGIKDEVDAVNQLLGLAKLDQFARQNPIEYIKQASRQLGVDLEALAFDYEQQSPQPQQNTQILELQGQIESLKQQVSSREYEGIASEINSFASATEADGSLKYPLFEQEFVKQSMGGLMEKDTNLSLEDAYKTVVAPLEQHYSKKSSAKAQAEQAKAEVAKAKKASRTVKTPSVVAGQVKQAQSLDEIISSSMKEKGLN